MPTVNNRGRLFGLGQKRTDVPGPVSRCELSEVIIQVDLQKLAPLGGRHLAEKRMRFPGLVSSRVPRRL